MENSDKSKPIIIADQITKFFPLRGRNKRQREETPFSYLKKEIAFRRKENLFKALDNVNFKIYPGESVGLIGSNGSGKSTLLRVLTGITQPSSGNAIVNGSFGELFSLNSGFNNNLTGRQNIFLFAAIKGIPKNEITERLQTIIEFSELGEFIDEPVKTYSSGMRGRLGFSIVTHFLLNVMFIDEALSTGDARFRKKCQQKFEEIFQNKSRTLIIVSHNLNTLYDICERAIWLEKGKLKMDGKIDEVLEAYKAFSDNKPQR